MPPHGGAIARPTVGAGLYRLAPLLVALLILLSLVRGAVRADPPSAVARISAEEARSANAAVTLVRHATTVGLLVEASLPPSLSSSSLLAVAPDAQSIALAGSGNAAGTGLILAAADGSQLRVQVPDLRAAIYTPAGDSLLAIDEVGALWQVDVASGEPEQLADGPFAGRPVVGPDGSILLLSVSSIEAPVGSVAVRLDSATGNLLPISDAELVYGIFPLAEGSLAIVAHQAGGTVVRRISGERDRRLADLGPGAVNVAVASDGSIAFERSGAVFVIGANGGPPREVIAGDHPIFAPGGSALLLLTDGGASLVGLDGSLIGRYGPQVGFAACPAGCAS